MQTPMTGYFHPKVAHFVRKLRAFVTGITTMKPYTCISMSYSEREWEEAGTEWARAESLLSLSVRSTRHPPPHEHPTTKCDAIKNRPMVTESISINELISFCLNKEQSIPNMVEILYTFLRKGKYVFFFFLGGEMTHTEDICEERTSSLTCLQGSLINGWCRKGPAHCRWCHPPLGCVRKSAEQVSYGEWASKPHFSRLSTFLPWVFCHDFCLRMD